MTYQYHHLHLICSDLEKMEHFFVDILGATVTDRQQSTSGARDIVLNDTVYINLGGQLICLRSEVVGEDITADSTQKRFGYDHFALLVENIDTAYENLKSKGIPFTAAPRNGKKARVAFFKGPDNIAIELFQPLN